MDPTLLQLGYSLDNTQTLENQLFKLFNLLQNRMFNVEAT